MVLPSLPTALTLFKEKVMKESHRFLPQMECFRVLSYVLGGWDSQNLHSHLDCEIPSLQCAMKSGEKESCLGAYGTFYWYTHWIWKSDLFAYLLLKVAILLKYSSTKKQTISQGSYLKLVCTGKPRGICHTSVSTKGGTCNPRPRLDSLAQKSTIKLYQNCLELSSKWE